MSRGQRARTPENFPRMKYRAAGRQAQKLSRGLDLARVRLEEMSAASRGVAASIATLAAFIQEVLEVELYPWQKRLLAQVVAEPPTRRHASVPDILDLVF
jgi:hypothetical protein